MTLRWPIGILLCACVSASGAVRAQTNPPPQTPQPAPAGPEQPSAGEQPAPAVQQNSDANATQAPVAVEPTASGPDTAAAATSQPPVPAPEGAKAEAEQGEAEKAKLPWSASLIWRQGYVVAGLDRTAYQSFNPTYTWTFLALLGYRFDKDTTLSLIQPATIELTDSASTNTRQELWFLDTILDLSHTFYEMEPVKDDQTLKLGAGVGVSLPLSKASQAESMIFAPR